MTRVDVIYADLGGVYIDGKWQAAEQVDCFCEDVPAEVEEIWTLGRSTPEIITTRAARRSWTIRLTIKQGSPNIEMVINDPEIEFWSNIRDYKTAREQYIINEMQP